jgi:putative membrane protein
MDVTLPQVLDAHLQKHVDQLKTLSGTEFDRAYASFMVGDHHDDIASFKQESQQTRNSQLEDFTKSNLPVLIKHLNLARHAWAAVKA